MTGFLLKIRETLKERTVFRHVLSGSMWLSVEPVTRLVLGVLVGAWVARYLGPERYGVLNYTLSIALVFTGVPRLGSPQALLRALVSHPEEEPDILGSSFMLSTLGAVSAFILSLVLCLTLAPGKNALLFMVALIAGSHLFRPFEVIMNWLLAKKNQKLVAIAGVFSLAAASLIRIALIKIEAGLPAFASVFMAHTALMAACLYIFYRQSSGRISRWRISRLIASPIAREGAVLVLWILLWQVFLRLDFIMLERLSSTTQTGLFAASSRLSEICHFIFPAAILSSLPHITESRKADKYRYTSRLNQLVFGIVIASYALMIPVGLLAPSLISILFGPEFRDAGPILALQSLSLPLTGLIIFQNNRDFMEHKASNVLFRIAAAVSLKFTINLFLIPHMQGAGAAISTFTSLLPAIILFSLKDVEQRRLLIVQIKALLLIRQKNDLPA